jgi:hypothetical protein
MKNRDRRRAEEAAAAGLQPRSDPAAGTEPAPAGRAAAPSGAKAARGSAPNAARTADTGHFPFIRATAVWFVLACVAGGTGLIARLTPPIPQVLIGVSTLALILTGVLHPGLRAWLSRVNLRGFVAFHLTRFVGIWFLVLYQSGELTGEFAVAAGWGDILTATGALGIAGFMRNPESKPWLLMLWNAFGLADILTVVVTATRIAMRTPSEMAPLLQFPMSLVPTFVVPLVIASHVLVFVRLRRLRHRDLDPGAR